MSRKRVAWGREDDPTPGSFVLVFGASFFSDDPAKYGAMTARR
jgi:hypothetical protein